MSTCTSTGAYDLGNDVDGQSYQAIPDGGTTYIVGTPTPGLLNAVPEPSSAIIFGLAGLGLLARRRK